MNIKVQLLIVKELVKFMGRDEAYTLICELRHAIAEIDDTCCLYDLVDNMKAILDVEY